MAHNTPFRFRLFGVALSLALLAAGCSPTKIPNTPNTLPPTSTDDVNTSTPEKAGPGYPDDVYKAQLKNAATLEGKIYKFVLQPSINEYIEGISGRPEVIDTTTFWHGVLKSEDGGRTWQKWFTIHDPMDPETKRQVKMNPVGIYKENNLLYLDLVDDQGAGSGEGRLTRLATKDDGATWQKSGCFYFTYETYFPNGNYDELKQAAPHNLPRKTNCIYEL